MKILHGSRVLPLSMMLCAALLSRPHQTWADTFYVGSGVGCTHPTLPAAVAAAESNGMASDRIYLTEDQTLTAALTITKTNVLVLGGTVSCGNPARSGRSRVDLDPGTHIFVGSVIALFDGIDFDHGTAPLGSSDRIFDVGGLFTFTLSNSSLSFGHASFGGNIRLAGGSGAQGRFENVVIRGGSATQIGGGIFCEGPVQMSWTGPIDIFRNQAGQNGGGVALMGGCSLDAGTVGRTPSSGGPVLIRSNKALLAAGGLYLTDAGFNGPSGATAATLRGGSLKAVNISKNTALLGGGVYLSNFDNLGDTQLTMYNTMVSQNFAAIAGGGLYLLGHSVATLDRSVSICHSADFCSALSSNQALGTQPFPPGFNPYPTGQGGAAFLDGPARLILRQTRIDHSKSANGASVLIAQGNDGRVEAEGVVLHANQDNGSSALLTMAGPGGSMRLAHVSSASNLTTDTGRLVAGGVTEIYSSVFGESKPKVLGNLSGGSKIDCVIVPSIPLLPIVPTRSTAIVNPLTLFVDPVNGNLHLTANSPAIDYCNTSNYTPIDRDIDHQARGVDHPKANLYGIHDVGADEAVP